jgi:hypothetical protein
VGLHAEYPLLLLDFNETGISRRIFEKYSNIKFHENPSSGIQVVLCGRRDVAKLMVTSRNFANATKN